MPRVTLLMAEPRFCGDNAAMIAGWPDMGSGRGEEACGWMWHRPWKRVYDALLVLREGLGPRSARRVLFHPACCRPRLAVDPWWPRRRDLDLVGQTISTILTSSNVEITGLHFSTPVASSAKDLEHQPLAIFQMALLQLGALPNVGMTRSNRFHCFGNVETPRCRRC
jgi:hypothetical protein